MLHGSVVRCQSTSSHGACRCFAQRNPVPALLECTESPPFAELCAQTDEHSQNFGRHPTHAVLQQTELLAGVINEQDCRDIRTACCCIRSLRIRVEARVNVTEREVISRQLQLMHASVQHYPTEDLNTADTSCLSRTSFEHFEDRSGP